jgi:hypothetical protein
MTYPYINRFSGTVTLPKIGEIFPGIWSEKFDRDINSNINPNHRGKDDCLVEIGTSKQITKDVPIQFSSGFDDYIFAITKKKSATSHCRELLLYDYHLLFRHQKMFCVVKMNASTKIKDIQLVK